MIGRFTATGIWHVTFQSLYQFAELNEKHSKHIIIKKLEFI